MINSHSDGDRGAIAPTTPAESAARARAFLNEHGSFGKTVKARRAPSCAPSSAPPSPCALIAKRMRSSSPQPPSPSLKYLESTVVVPGDNEHNSVAFQMNEEALQRRVPSSDDGFIVEEGDIVQLVDSNEKYTVLSIAPFSGGPWDVGGNTLKLQAYNNAEASPTWSYTSDSVCIVDGGCGRSSFCEFCDIYFDTDFVTWNHDRGGELKFKPYFKVRNSLTMHKLYSACDRCLEVHSQGRELWKWVRLIVKARSIVLYWKSLAHVPKCTA